MESLTNMLVLLVFLSALLTLLGLLAMLVESLGRSASVSLPRGIRRARRGAKAAFKQSA
jgi:hypothetical protein